MATKLRKSENQDVVAIISDIELQSLPHVALGIILNCKNVELYDKARVYLNKLLDERMSKFMDVPK